MAGTANIAWIKGDNTASFLLDTYPGALGAYSLRQLRAAQTNCIRVIRGGDSAEQDFGFVSGVLDTASLLTFCAGTNGNVMTMYDQSGNGNDIIALNASLRPFIVVFSVLNTTNGKATVDFLVNGDPRYLGFPTGFLNGATNLSYFQVAKITEYTSSLGGVFGPLLSAFTGLEILQLGVISRPTFFRFNGGTAKNDNSGVAYQIWNDATQSLTTILGNPTSTAAYKNSSAVTLTDTSAMPALNFNGVYNFGIYNSGPDMYGDMQELIIYSADQSANRAAIEANISSYYSSNGSYDFDAQGFITVAGITDAGQKAAINTLVVAAKAHGWWSKCLAIYPMVGGDATKHAVNLKSPGIYNLAFSGGWTHSSTGALPNGSTGYADTGIIPDTHLIADDTHLSYYSRSITTYDAIEMGSSIFPTFSVLQLIIEYSSSNIMATYAYNDTTGAVGATEAGSDGYFMGSRTSSSNHILVRNGSVVNSNSTSGGSLPSPSIYIGARNAGGAEGFSNRECAFATIGSGVDSSLAATMYNDIQAFQTTLSRQV